MNQRTIHDFYSVDCVPKYIIFPKDVWFYHVLFPIVIYNIYIYISQNIIDTHSCIYSIQSAAFCLIVRLNPVGFSLSFRLGVPRG